MPENWFFETLPLHPFPYEGECLSGYLLRLAELNGYAILWDLIGDLFPMWTAPQQTGMLKWEYPLENWGRIPLRTGLTSAELNRLSVASWVEKFRFPINITRSKYESGACVTRHFEPEPACLFSVFAIPTLFAIDLAIVAGDNLS